MSANFRALFQLQFNQWSKYPKQAHLLWPLSIDQIEHEELTEEEMYQRAEVLINKFKDRFSSN